MFHRWLLPVLAMAVLVSACSAGATSPTMARSNGAQPVLTATVFDHVPAGVTVPPVETTNVTLSKELPRPVVTL